MVSKSHFVLSFLFFTFLSITHGEKNDCGEDRDLFDRSAYQYLNFIQPLRYQIYIDPCISDGNFTGYIHIDLLVHKATRNLSLHSQDLQFCEDGVYLTLKGSASDTVKHLKMSKSNNNTGANVSQTSDELIDDSSNTVKPAGFVHHKFEQAITMTFRDVVKPGRYSLEINYVGTINTDPVGLYRKLYTDSDGQNKLMLLTNLTPMSARRVFPCRDEPGIKTKTHLTVQTFLNLTTVVAKAPKNSIELKEGQRWNHYQPIGNVSTHQLNFAVISDMKNFTQTQGNKTFVVYATESDIKSVKLAQDIYKKAIEVMEDYTKLSLPSDTLATVIIPEETDLITSASLGFISTQRTRFLYNEKYGPSKKKDVVMKATRDITNQWFNQLISPKAWKYAWLTDGLAEYMQYQVADKIMAKWRLKDMFVTWELHRRSFIPNKITDSPPLNRDTYESPKDVKCLMKRSYSSTGKGASMIRMMSNFLSEKVLRCGLISFFKRYKYKSVEPKDFWESIQDAINISKDDRLVKMNLSEIMKSWIDEDFYPILHVTRNNSTGSIQLTQSPAVKLFELTDKKVTSKWWIPINYATQTNPNFNRTRPSHWLRPKDTHLTINGVDPKDWVLFNVQQTGYYRVLYDKENWKKLVAALNDDDFEIINPVNRAQIISDAIQFSLKNKLDMDIFFDLISYLRKETDYIPWYDAQFILSFLNYHLSNTQAFDSFKTFALNLLIPLVDRIGYEDQPGDSFSTLLLRRMSNRWACHFGYERCWKNATEQLESYLNGEKAEMAPTDLQEWAKCVGLKGANQSTWDKMFKKYQESMSEDVLIHLGCSENLTILKHLLDTSISNDSKIPEKHVLTALKSVCLYPSGDDKRLRLCLDFFGNRFGDIITRFNNSTESLINILDLFAAELKQKSQLDQYSRILGQDRASFACSRLKPRVKQIAGRIPLFNEKAAYYEPFLKRKNEEEKLRASKEGDPCP
ncbi:hypothetical protein QAD02_018040 [Eretmocerus hayati]|uniref:Uncharacterized protein n=1 Tax=Eretmocerus hayati TaxID=131215 RepID=A0ACC2PGR3_9HYME|nr:hypothetical protein QAD02_018040 [Eretmocerus hayati]